MKSLLKDKQGIAWLLNTAYVIVAVIMLVGIGLAVTSRLGGTFASCTGSTCGTAGVWNMTTDVCSNATSASCATPTGSVWTAINYGNTQLGSAGLLGYLPIIIILLVGMFFFSYFMGGKKGKM